MKSIHEYSEIVFGVCILCIAIVLTLFQHWEMTHETWQYWFFAREFAEGGGFVIPDRSPVYILYLQLFRWLGYPQMVIVEYTVTTLISSIVLVFFLRPYVRLTVGVFAVLLWLPYLQISEPSVQKLAMAAGLFAVMVRRNSSTRRSIAFSYLFFIAAYALRSSYGAVALLFFAWDGYRYCKKNTISQARLELNNDWPIITGVACMFLVVVFQSSHRWNNVWGATTTWFPSDGKSFTRMLQNYNMSYILQTYGSYDDRDFYFTNTEVFGKAQDLFQAMVSNPEFFVRTALEYMRVGTAMTANLTQLPSYLSVGEHQTTVFVVILGILMAGAYLQGRDGTTRMFVIGTTAMILVTFVHMPKERYFVFIIPILLLSATWYGTALSYAAGFVVRFLSEQFQKVVQSTLVYATTTAVVLFFSSGPMASTLSGVMIADWPTLLNSIVADFKNNDLSVMEFRDTSVYFPPMKRSYTKIIPHTKVCKGIMTMEYTFLGAFTDIPIEKIFDIWEIPPFDKAQGKPLEGSNRDWVYRGLTPERIDCLMISKNLKYGTGAATNSALRYHHYIKPYAEYLVAHGAKSYQIDGFGDFIVYAPSSE